MADLFGSIASVAGPVLAGWLGAEGQENTNVANAQQAQAQMDFQERMSNTSYQRAVKDLAAAGLNPMLAYSRGGASTPGGAMASMGNPMEAGMSSAARAATVAPQVELIKSQVGNTQADTELKRSTAGLQNTQALLNAVSVAEIEARTRNYGFSSQHLEQMIRRLREENDLGYPGFSVNELHSRGWRLAQQGRKDYVEAEIEQMLAAARRNAATAQLEELRKPQFQNEAAMHMTGWGKDVLPYLPGVQMLSNSAGQLGRGLLPRLFR